MSVTESDGSECYLDFWSTWNWRAEKARQYPMDTRNSDAVKLLQKLEQENEQLKGSDIHARLCVAARALDEFEFANGGGPWDFGPQSLAIISEELRSVGFHSFPSSCREFLEGICETLEETLKELQADAEPVE